MFTVAERRTTEPPSTWTKCRELTKIGAGQQPALSLSLSFCIYTYYVYICIYIYIYTYQYIFGRRILNSWDGGILYSQEGRTIYSPYIFPGRQDRTYICTYILCIYSTDTGTIYSCDSGMVFSLHFQNGPSLTHVVLTLPAVGCILEMKIETIHWKGRGNELEGAAKAPLKPSSFSTLAEEL